MHLWSGPKTQYNARGICLRILGLVVFSSWLRMTERGKSRRPKEGYAMPKEFRWVERGKVFIILQ
jgi:hypothetical protein